MLGKLSCMIFGLNWMSSGPESNAPNDEQPDQERTAADIASGLEEVVRLNRLQFEAFQDIKADLVSLTERIKSGRLLLLPRAHRPSAPRRNRRAD